jgi:hypothetical protein
MKKWNNPEIAILEVTKTENGRCDLIPEHGSGKIGCISYEYYVSFGHPVEESGKGDDLTAPTNDPAEGNS